MDLLKKFEGILEQYGYNVLVLHKDKKTSCTCFDEKTQSADRLCPFCFGLGSVPVITKETIRELDSSVPMTLPLITQTNAYGALAVATRAYFFKREAKIGEQDLIIDVSWQGNLPVYENKGIYEINHIDPQRFLKGELIFQKAYVKDTPINKKIRGFKVVETAHGQLRYFMAEEKEGN